MCSPRRRDPDPEIPILDEPTETETETIHEESQNPHNPEPPQTQESQQDEKVVHNQEDPKSSLEEIPVQQPLGKSLSSPTAIHMDLTPNRGDMICHPLISPTNPFKLNPRHKRSGGYTMKLNAAMSKIHTLMSKLNPIPFIPSKILDFSSHEKLLKRLGLWDFVHIDFNQKVHAELIAQLVVTYKPKSKRSYVKGLMVKVSRADLARALSLPVKKEKCVGNVAFSEEMIGFIEDFVSIWVLLHDDSWVMPSEVLNVIKLIKDGSLEKVDWAWLLWLMVEKELSLGVQLEDSYYAVHLQYLIKSQHEELFLAEELENGQLNVAVKDETILRLCTGKENMILDDHEEKKEENLANEEVRKFEFHVLPTDDNLVGDGFKGNSPQGMEADDLEEKKEENLANEEVRKLEFHLLPTDDNLVGDGFKGNSPQGMEADDLEEKKEENLANEQVRKLEFHVLPTDDNFVGDGFKGNSPQGMETDEPFLQGKEIMILDDHEERKEEEIKDGSGQSLFGYGRSNKRSRAEGSLNHKPIDFVACMDEGLQLMTRARMMMIDEANNPTWEQLNIHNQTLLSECHQRDALIHHLQKIKMEEIQKRDNMIYRLEDELSMMRNIMNGYRNSLKHTNKEFADYIKRAQPHLKQEEYKSKCFELEQKAKEAEEVYAAHFEMYKDKVLAMGVKLMSLSSKVEELKEQHTDLKRPKLAKNY